MDFDTWLVNKFCLSDSPYDWLLILVDKPFFQTHGMCFIFASMLAMFTYVLSQKLIENYYKACQDLTQKSISSFDKIIQKALKKK